LSLPLWLVALISELEILGQIAATVSIIINGYLLRKKLKSISIDFDVLSLGAMSLILIQNIAWLISGYVHVFQLKRSSEYFLSKILTGISFQEYALAIIYINVFCIVLACFSLYPKYLRIHRSLNQRLLGLLNYPLNKLRFFLIGFFIVQIVLIATGIIGKRTINVEGYDQGKIPFWLPIFQSIIPLYQIIWIVYFRKLKSFRFWDYFQASLYIAPTLFIAFSGGRSSFVFTLFFLVFWWIFFGGKIRLYHLVLGAISIPIISFVLVFNEFLRNYNSDLPMGSLVSKAYTEYVSSSSKRDKFQEKSIRNIATRPLVAGPLAAVLSYPEGLKSFTYGENIQNSLVWALPMTIFGEKKSFPIREDLLYAHFRIGSKDLADSLYLSSYTEFGYFGVLFYPLLLFSLVLFTLNLLISLRSHPFIIAMSLGIFFDLFVFRLGEGALLGWFTALRSILFFIVIGKIIQIQSRVSI
tara:strand:- start:7860 stop:9266 length:1407 start_codon:yes stop_codon:yes gene_type:complete